MDEIDVLIGQLEDILDGVNQSIEWVNNQAEILRSTPATLRNSDGSFMLAPLLHTKMKTLLALRDLRKERESRQKAEAAWQATRKMFGITDEDSTNG